VSPRALAIPSLSLCLVTLPLAVSAAEPPADVRFRGLRTVREQELRPLVSPAPSDEAGVRRAVQALWATGDFDDIRVTREPGLVFSVRERPLVAAVTVTGPAAPLADRVRATLDIREGMRLDAAAVARAVDRLRQRYADEGYYFADVNYTLSPRDPDHVQLALRVDPHQFVEVNPVRFAGNAQVPATELQRALAAYGSRPRDFLTDEGAAREVLIVSAVFYDRGYINVQVSSPELHPAPDHAHMEVVVRVREGRQYRLGKLAVRGHLLGKPDELVALIGVRTGEVFSRARLVEGIERVRARYRDAGRAQVTVTPQTAIDTERLVVDVTLEIEEEKPR
jgi:outer membrane protein insertion porin family